MTTRKRILVIESPPEVIPQLLRVSGHLVMSRSEPADAEELWNKAAGGFDLVIIDDRTGAQTLIPAMVAYKADIKILLMTARPVEKQLLMENVLVLCKPVSPTRLAEAVNS